MQEAFIQGTINGNLSGWSQAEAQLQRVVEISEAVGHPDTEMFRQVLAQVQANM